jgi:hypothetical protein
VIDLRALTGDWHYSDVKLRTAFLVAAVFLSVDASASQPSCDAAAIYAAPFHDFLKTDPATAKLTLVVRSMTVPVRDRTVEALRKSAPSLSGPAAFAWVLDATLSTPLPAELVRMVEAPRLWLVSPEAMDRELNEGWQAFHRRFGGGYVAFSSIVCDGNTAAFQFESPCGMTCGQGTLVILEKHGKSWRVREQVNLWIS